MNGFDAAEAFLAGKTVTTSEGSRNISDVRDDNHLGFILDLARGHITDAEIADDSVSWTALKGDLFELAGCGDSRMRRLNERKQAKKLRARLDSPEVSGLYEHIRARVRELQDAGVLTDVGSDAQRAAFRQQLIKDNQHLPGINELDVNDEALQDKVDQLHWDYLKKLQNRD